MIEFGWYEIGSIVLIIAAHIHGIYEGRKQSMERGVEITLKMLEDQGIIKVNETGEITPVCDSAL